MSKRLGNFFTLRDVLAKGYSGRELRYALLSGAHYSKNLNFSWKAIDDARAALHRLDEWRARLKDFVVNGAAGTQHAPLESEDAKAEKTEHFPTGESLFQAFSESLAKDLNVSDGLGNVFTAVREGHRALNAGLMNKSTAQGFLDAWAKIDQLLALGDALETIPDAVYKLVEQRKEARGRKDFKQSDELRKQIIALGWQVKDGPKGQELVKV
jgi:cysteinyl-tRNA synthetase